MSVSPPLVSVVTVVWNGAHEVARTLESVLAQSYPSIELIVVDGGSSDGTQAVVSKYASRLAAFVSEKDKGTFDAQNKGAALARGEWIIFMNSGDCFNGPDALSSIQRELESDADGILCGVEKVWDDGVQRRVFREKPLPISEAWRVLPACHQSILLRTSHQVYYNLDLSYRWCADQHLILRMVCDGRKFASSDVLLSVFDCTSGNARDPMQYIRERWRLTRGLVPLPRRLRQFGWELYHCRVWGAFVRAVKPLVPTRWLLKLRKVRGTAGDVA